LFVLILYGTNKKNKSSSTYILFYFIAHFRFLITYGSDLQVKKKTRLKKSYIREVTPTPPVAS